MRNRVILAAFITASRALISSLLSSFRVKDGIQRQQAYQEKRLKKR